MLDREDKVAWLEIKHIMCLLKLLYQEVGMTDEIRCSKNTSIKRNKKKDLENG